MMSKSYPSSMSRWIGRTVASANNIGALVMPTLGNNG